jgi:pantoate--beta-alanine ligase
MRKVMAGEPTVQIDYLAICDPTTLEPLTTIDRETVLLGAIRIGAVRLIDNVVAKRPVR